MGLNIYQPTTLVTLFLVFSAGSATQENQRCTLTSLLEQRQLVYSTEAEFTQTTDSTLLTTPQSIRGYLYYERGAKLSLKLDTSPQTDISITRSELVIRKGTRQNRLPLSTVWQFGQHLVALQSVMSGDRDSLTGKFETRFSGTCEDWQLLLIPRRQTGNKRESSDDLTYIRVSGSNFEVIEVVVERTTYSRITIRIENSESLTE